MTLSVSNAKESLEKLQHCLMGVSAWMTGSKLKLNPSKREFLLIETKLQREKISWDIARSCKVSKGHGKVKSTQNSSKYLVFAVFPLLCSLQMVMSSQGHSNVKLSIKTCDKSLLCSLQAVMTLGWTNSAISDSINTRKKEGGGVKNITYMITKRK